jgi:hypothetical protein
MNSASDKVLNEYLKNNRHSIGKCSSSSALSQSGTKVLSNSFLNLILWSQALFCADLTHIITIYAPLIYTAPCIMFWMRAYPLRGQVGGGLALEFKSFLGPVKWHRTQEEGFMAHTEGVEEQVHKGTYSLCSAAPPHYKTY